MQLLRSSVRTSVILAFLLLVHTGWSVWRSATNTPTIDFFTFWSVPHALPNQPVGNIYSAEGQRALGTLMIAEARTPTASKNQRQATGLVLQLYGGRIDATSSPLLYTMIGWLSSGDYETGQKRFMFACLLCLALSILVLQHLLRFSAVATMLLMMYLSWNYNPVLADIRVGNVNEIQLFAVTLFIFFAARSQPLLAGLAIGAATMFKPTTLMVLVLIVIAGLADRDYRQLWRTLAGCLIAAGASVIASAAYFGGPAMWLDFIRSLPKTLGGASYVLENGNFSLSALLFGANGGSSAVILLILLAGFSWLMFATRRIAPNEGSGVSPDEIAQRRMHNAFAVGGIGCGMMLLSSPLAWLHYYLLLIPLSLYVIRPVSENEEASSLRSILARALPFVPFMMFSVMTELFVGRNAWLGSVLVNVATVSTVALASYQIWQQRGALNSVPLPAARIQPSKPAPRRERLRR